jgi:hypothetical protein
VEEDPHYAPLLGYFIYLHKLTSVVEHLAQLVQRLGIVLSSFFSYSDIYHLS